MVLFLSGITVLKRLIILSIAQASSSFQCLDMYTFTYATLIFITEAFHLVTQVQLFLRTATVN